MRLSVAFALSIVVAMPALASETGAQPADTASAAKPEKAKKICRKAVVMTGTRMGGGRACKTAEEWAAHDDRTASQLRNLDSIGH